LTTTSRVNCAQFQTVSLNQGSITISHKAHTLYVCKNTNDYTYYDINKNAVSEEENVVLWV
jgi:hypothetical protein